MDLHNYNDLLDKAFEKIPENVKKSSRFEIPTVELRIESRNTFITNFNRIISTLNRDRKHFLGIFLKTVGTMGEIRGDERQQLFLKGQYKEQVLNKLIENYTKTY
ncbi:MAG: translation initiation factor IF-2 subunit beta, partial [Promethearchaeota archaeon]